MIFFESQLLLESYQRDEQNMITIKSEGRLGNKLHYFIFGMYAHELKNMYFMPERIEGFVETYNHKNGEINSNQIKTSTIYKDFNELYKNIKEMNNGFIIDNMLHKYTLLRELDVKRYLLMEKLNYASPEKDELVIHIRLGDYRQINDSVVINKNLYLEVIAREKNNINNITILTDSPEDKYLDDFKILGCNIRKGTELEDFFYIKEAKKICISNSTFSWTSAYISNAESIYWPISCNLWPYYTNPGEHDADLRPLDKKNWLYL